METESLSPLQIFRNTLLTGLSGANAMELASISHLERSVASLVGSDRDRVELHLEETKHHLVRVQRALAVMTGEAANPVTLELLAPA
jgi:ferritin-like metal-binding protein YciE